jgi:hypothetical protein
MDATPVEEVIEAFAAEGYQTPEIKDALDNLIESGLDGDDDDEPMALTPHEIDTLRDLLDA